MKRWIFVFLTAGGAFSAPAETRGASSLPENPDSLKLVSAPPAKTRDKGFAFHSFHFLKNHSVELGVEVPLNFGIHGSVRLTDTTYTRLGFGWIYENFLGVFAKVAPHLGYITEDEANLMIDVIKSSLYLDARLGWMPYMNNYEGGPYIEAGVSGMLFGQGKTDADTLRKTLNTKDDINDIEAGYSVRSNVYNATFHLGYQIPFEKNLKLNIDLGILKIFHLTAAPADSIRLKPLPQKKYKELRDLLLKKGWIFPTVSLWLSFKF